MARRTLPIRTAHISVTAHVLRSTQLVHAELGDVFGFFEDPMNLERITPPWLNFRVRSVSDTRMRSGTEIEYRLRWQVFPLTWHSRISEYEHGTLFADEMLRGPYRSWYHRHYFERVESGVLMTDVVEYELPFGPLGRLVHRLVIRSQLHAIFEYRRLAIGEVFPAPAEYSCDHSSAHLPTPPRAAASDSRASRSAPPGR